MISGANSLETLDNPRYFHVNNYLDFECISGVTVFVQGFRGWLKAMKVIRGYASRRGDRHRGTSFLPHRGE